MVERFKTHLMLLPKIRPAGTVFKAMTSRQCDEIEDLVVQGREWIAREQ